MPQGREKGFEYEREVAKKLSRWLTNGATQDCIWRTPGSGARSHVLQGSAAAQTSGDLMLLDPSYPVARDFCDTFVVELKRRRILDWGLWLHQDQGEFPEWWSKLCKEAARVQRCPMLIARADRKPAVCMVPSIIAEEHLPRICWRNMDVQAFLLEDLLRHAPEASITAGRFYITARSALSSVTSDA